MDVFEPGHQFGDYDFQLDDHNPGVSEQGVFWTVPIIKDSVSGSLAERKFEFCLSDVLMPDLHDLLTALWGGGELDGEGKKLGPVFSSTVSLHARWFDAGPVAVTRDAVNQFVYQNVRTNGTIQWRSVRRGVMFESDDGPQKLLFSAVGTERNGVYFV